MAYSIKRVTLSFIASACGGEILFGDCEGLVESISTDSRDCNGAMFIALSGERFDGNTFIPSACDGGAVGYITDSDCVYDKCAFAIRVENTRRALLDIAKAYRSLFNIKVVGLTGSVGKTTTKELVSAVLETERSVIKTKGNFNNDVGLPLTLFGIRDTHEIGVIEMGMSNFGEISVLTQCAKPDVAVITNIGESHIEYLGSRQGILKAKSEIFEGLAEGGVAILNGDDELLFGIKGTLPFKTIYYGIENAACDIVAGAVRAGNNGISFTVDGEEFNLKLAGRHNVLNALCAIALGRHFGISEKNIKSALASYEASGIRQSITEKNGIKVITDCYNAAPTSVKAAIEVLSSMESNRKIAVLGDMAELGERAREYHEEIGGFAARNNIDILVLIGENASYVASAAKGCRVSIHNSNESIIKYLEEILTPGDAVLFKGSRVMRLEEAAEKFN